MNIMAKIHEGSGYNKIMSIVWEHRDRHGGTSGPLPVPVWKLPNVLLFIQEIKAILGSTLLNDQQYSAYSHALSQDLTVIHGLPGTGKTLIGALASVAAAQLRNERTLIVAKSTSSLIRMMHLLRKSEGLDMVLFPFCNLELVMMNVKTVTVNYQSVVVFTSKMNRGAHLHNYCRVITVSLWCFFFTFTTSLEAENVGSQIEEEARLSNAKIVLATTDDAMREELLKQVFQ